MFRKILILEFNNHTPHLETSFEIAKKHLNLGDHVHYFFGGHDVPYEHGISVKRIPIRWLGKGCLPEEIAANLITSENFFYSSEVDFSPFVYRFQENFENIDELMDYKIDDCELGLSVASTIIFDLKTSHPDLKANQERINIMLSSALAVYRYTNSLIDSLKPDLVYFFNGRFVNYRSIMNACQTKQVAFMIHERGANIYRYTIRQYMPHDFKKIGIEIMQLWQKAKWLDKSVDIASQFFIDRRAGIEQAWISYTKAQKAGQLPYLYSGKRVISFFTSSDDEFKAVGDIVKWDRWVNQMHALTDVISICLENQEFQLVIRIHPHVSMKSKQDQDFWNNLDIPESVTLVRSDDNIDTYALIERSDVVITSGSTTGIESVFWGTPSICLGPSIYGGLDAVYLPKDKEELKMLLFSDLQADIQKSYPYGYYMMENGEKFKYFKATGLFSGKFLDVDLTYNARRCKTRKISRLFSAVKNKLKIG